MFSTNGKWCWNEEKIELEFSPFNALTEKDKRKRNKTAAHESAFKKIERNKSGIRSRSFSYGKAGGSRRESCRSSVKHHISQLVTIDEIKIVAKEMMEEVDVISYAFYKLYYTEQLDNFLLHLVQYFHYFFSKMTQENKQKGNFMSRISHTHKDRSMFETLYKYATFVVWITFNRKHYDVIKQEIGRLFRSEIFNSAVKAKKQEEFFRFKDKAKQKGPEDTKRRSVVAERRKEMYPPENPREPPVLIRKRPPIKTIISQRSPAVVSILPLPKENAAWLFEKRDQQYPLPPEKQTIDIRNEKKQLKKLENFYNDWKEIGVGILGLPMIHFNPMTLTRISNVGDEVVNEAAIRKFSIDGRNESPPLELKTDRQQPSTLSRSTTVVSTEDET